MSEPTAAPTTEVERRPRAHASHTPGPWWIVRRIGDALQVNAHHRGEGSSYCVASINHWEGDADKANAHLIAAAPDLLEALKAASAELAQYVDLQQKLDYIEYAADTQKKLDAINTVIAKAEGRQQVDPEESTHERAGVHANGDPL